MKTLKNRILPIITLIILVLLTTPVYATQSSFNLKDHIDIPIKSQRDTGACWTLAMGTAFETNLALKSNIITRTSSRHMDYATSQSFTEGAVNEMGFAKEVNSGGTAELALAYLTNGSGPVPEDEMPFAYEFGNISISEIQNKTREYQVQKWVQFPGIYKKDNETYIDEDGNIYTKEQVNQIRTQIKEHIMKNGAVYAGINAAVGFEKYYNPSTYAYNCNDYSAKTDHAIVIIGWDDNYSKTKFKENCIPSENGAWIVQNSWGNDRRLNNGTFYISYEDVIIETDTYGIVDVSKINYDKIYQYDELGRNQYFEVNGVEEAYGANVFPRGTTAIEYLNQIAISTYMPVECEIYVNPSSGEIKESSLTKVATAILDPGYNTITLSKAVNLTGDKFAVVVKYKKITDLLGVTTISSYNTEDGGNPYRSITSAPGESYVGVTLNNMYDLYTSGHQNTNICIKAFINEFMHGDINGNGIISALDLSLLQSTLVGITKLDNESYADVNRDGRISAVDLSMLMKILVGM